MKARRALTQDLTYDDSELRLQKLYAERFESPELSMRSSTTQQAASESPRYVDRSQLRQLRPSR